MRLGREAGFVGASGFHFLQARFDEVDEEALRVDASDLHITVRIAVEDELIRDVIREAAVERGSGCGELRGDEFAFLREGFQCVEGVAVVRESLVQFADEGAHFGNEFDEAFGNENGSEFFAVGRAVGDGV